MSGLIFGLCFGRVFSGVIAYTASWRDTYWLAVGVQTGQCRWQPYDVGQRADSSHVGGSLAVIA